MVLLKEPSEERLWVVIAGLFAVSLVLLVASLGQPWFTASFYSGSSEIHGRYWFEEWRYELCSNGDCTQGLTQGYRDSTWEGLMETAKVLVGIGVVGLVGFGILLALYYHGFLERTGWIKVAWLIGFVGTLVGITYFALNAGSAGARQLEALVQQYGLTGFGRPDEDQFWGTQPYANGDLVSAPGVGWLLAILALVNLIPPTLLLYQFPEPEGDGAEEEFGVEEEGAPEVRAKPDQAAMSR